MNILNPNTLPKQFNTEVWTEKVGWDEIYELLKLSIFENKGQSLKIIKVSLSSTRGGQAYICGDESTNSNHITSCKELEHYIKFALNRISLPINSCSNKTECR